MTSGISCRANKNGITRREVKTRRGVHFVHTHLREEEGSAKDAQEKGGGGGYADEELIQTDPERKKSQNGCQRPTGG